MRRGLGRCDGGCARRIARLSGLARLARFGGAAGIIAAIVSRCRLFHRHVVLALFHRTGLLECIRVRDALEGNREKQQEDK